MADRTALGTLVTGIGWFSFGLAFLWGSIGPALVGVALLALVAGARWSVTSARVELDRRVPERVEMNQRFTTRLTASTQHALLPLRIHDVPPLGVRVLDRSSTRSRAQAEEELVLLPEEPGMAQWGKAHVRLADPWGFFEASRSVVLSQRTEVAPEGRWAASGQRLGRRNPIEATSKNQRAHEPEPEMEHVRPYMPGDRLRDIDWARTSRLPGLYTWVRERSGPRPMVTLLDATTTMRWRRTRSKLATAVGLVYGLVAAASGAGVSARLISFDERGVDQTMSSGGTRRPLVQALQRLANLEGPLPGSRPPSPASEQVERTLSEAEERFLKALSPFVRGPTPSAAPLSSALSLLQRGTSYPGVVVAILDAEQAPSRARVTIDRLTRAGHQVALVIPATGAHHYTKREARGKIMEDLVEARKNRERVKAYAEERKVPVFTLFPGEQETVLRKVMAWVQ